LREIGSSIILPVGDYFQSKCEYVTRCFFSGGNHLSQPIDDEELLAEEDEDDPEADKEEKKSLKERLQAIQEVTQSVQNSIGYMASLGEEVKKYTS
jgi:hypothetical protein